MVFFKSAIPRAAAIAAFATHLFGVVSAKLIINDPDASKNIKAGTSLTVSWRSDDEAPSMADIGRSDIQLCVKQGFDIVVLQTLENNIDVSNKEKTSIISHPIDASITANCHNYFIRVISLGLPDPTYPDHKWAQYSGNFTLAGMSGSIPNGGICPPQSVPSTFTASTPSTTASRTANGTPTYVSQVASTTSSRTVNGTPSYKSQGTSKPVPEATSVVALAVGNSTASFSANGTVSGRGSVVEATNVAITSQNSSDSAKVYTATGPDAVAAAVMTSSIPVDREGVATNSSALGANVTSSLSHAVVPEASITPASEAAGVLAGAVNNVSALRSQFVNLADTLVTAQSASGFVPSGIANATGVFNAAVTSTKNSTGCSLCGLDSAAGPSAAVDIHLFKLVTMTSVGAIIFSAMSYM